MPKNYKQILESQIQNQWAEKALDSISNIVVLLDRNGNVFRVNDHAEKILGYKEKDLIGKDWFKTFLPDKTVKEVRQVWECLIKSKKKNCEHYQNPIKNKNGETINVLWSNVRIRHGGEVIAVLSIGTDVSEWKSLETELQQSEEKYRLLIENVPSVVWITNENGETTFISPNVEDLYGYTPEDVYERGEELWFGRIHPEDIGNVKKAFKELFGKGKRFDVEYRIKRKDGEWIWIHDLARVHKEENGKKRAYGVFTDITARKSIEHDLLKEKGLLRTITDTSPVGIIVTDRDGNITFANPTVQKTLGLTLDKITKRKYNSPAWEITDYDGNPFPQSKLPFALVKSKLKPVFGIRHAIQKPSGERILLSVNAVPIKDNKKFNGMVATVDDVTHDIFAQKKLEIEQKRYRGLFDKMKSGVAVYQAVENGKNFKVVEFNPAASRFEKIKKESVIGKSVTEVFPSIKEFGLFDVFVRVWKTGNSEHFPVTFYEDERISGWRDNYVYKLPTGEIVSVYDDLTEEKQLEEALKESEYKYRVLVERAKDGILLIQDEKILFANSAALKMGNYKEEDVVGKSFVELIDPDDRKNVVKRYRDRIAGKKVKEIYDTKILKKDGTSLDVEVNAGILKYEGRLANLVFLRNITERKLIEKSLRENESLLMKIAENYPNSYMSIVEKDFTIGFTSGKEFTRQKLDPDKFVGMPIEKIFGDKSDFVKSKYRKAFKGEDQEFELVVGDQHQLYTVVPLPDDDGKINRILAVVENITERKARERLLLESENKFRSITENAVDYIFIKNQERKYTFVNKAMQELLGVSEDKILGKTPAEVFGKEQALIINEIDDDSFAGKTVNETRSLYIGGVERYLNTIQTPLSREGNKVTSIVGIVRDVTDSVLSEKELKDEKNRLSQIIDGSSIAIGVIDCKGVVTHWNKVAENITGVKSKDMIGSKDIWKPFYAKRRPVLANLIVEGAYDEIKKNYGDIVRKSKVVSDGYEAESFFLKLGENGMWLFFSAAPIRNEGGEIIGAIETFQDISYRKRAEEKIENIAKFPAENPNPVFRVGYDGVCLYMNPAAKENLKLWGLTIGNKLPKRILEIVEEVKKRREKIVKELVVGELIYLFAIVPVKDEEYINFYGRDITLRVESERLVSDSEAKYRSLFDNMAAGFAFHEMIYDKNGKPIDYRFLEVNDTFGKLTGLDTDTIVGKTILEIVPEIKKDDFDWIKTYGEVATSGKSIVLEDQRSEVLNKWYSIVAYSPKKGYFATVFVDITDRKKVEDKLRDTLDELEKTNIDLSRLNKFMVGREIRMKELKDRIRQLETELGKSPTV